MDEIKGKDACSSMPKSNDFKIEDEIEKERNTEEISGGKSASFEIEIASSEIIGVKQEQLHIPNPIVMENEQFVEELDMLVGGDKISNVEVEMPSSELMTMNGKDSIVVLNGKESKELTKESKVYTIHEVGKEHSIEKLNNEENPNELEHEEEVGKEVDNEEHPNEELEREEDVLDEVNNKENSNEELEHEEEVIEEMNNEEYPNEELECEEDPKEDLEHEEQANDEVTNEGQVQVTSKKKTTKSKRKGKRGLKKKIAPKSATRVIAQDTNDHQLPNVNNLQMVVKLNNSDKIDEEMVHEGNLNQQVKNEEQVKDISQKKTNNLKRKKKDSKKKIASTGLNEITVKDTNGKEPSNKMVKEAKVMGMIFMCSSKTKQDCYRYNVLGLPANKRDVVLQIHDGMKLFLFDFDLKLLYGIYKAAGPGGYNIEPKAFKSAFPSQVRFSVHEDCLPVPEEKFKKVIKDNYYSKNKFDFQLTSEQVKNLCNLFQVASSKSKQLLRNSLPETHKFTDQDRSKPHCDPAETHTDAADRKRKRTRKRRKQPENHTSAGDMTRKSRLNGDTRGLPDQGRTGKRRRTGETRRLPDQDRTGKRRRTGETRRLPDRDRTGKRRPAGETHRSSDLNWSSKRRHGAYERETYVPPTVAPLPLRAPLPAASSLAFPPRSYAYEGPSEMLDNYPLIEHQDVRFREMRDPLVEHQGIQYRDLDLSRREHFEPLRISFQGHHDGRFLDSELRRTGEVQHDGRFLDSELRRTGEVQCSDPYSSYRELSLRPGEVQRRDPYYRDVNLHNGLSYSVAQPSDYHSRSMTSLHFAAVAPNTGLYDRYASTRARY